MFLSKAGYGIWHMVHGPWYGMVYTRHEHEHEHEIRGFNMKHESAWAFPIIGELELELEFYLTGYMVLFASFTGGRSSIERS